MKIFLLAPNENWIVDRMVSEFTHANSTIATSDPNDADVLWLLAGWCWDQVPQQLLRSKPVVLTVHHIDPLKFNDDAKAMFLFRDHFVDAYHVPNKHTAAFVAQLTNKPIFTIGYWYVPEVWTKPNGLQMRDKYGLPSNKLLVGSFQRDTEGGTRLPKLAKGPDVFCDQVIQLATLSDIHVVIAGWRREYVIDRLQLANVPFTFFDRASMSTLWELYNVLDLYLVTSRHEGGPQAILECAAMKIPILSTDVGMARDVLCDNCIVAMPTETLRLPTENDIEMNFANVQKYSISAISQKYIAMFESVRTL